MSKLTRSDLKVIVKECLVEILAEGLGELQRPSAANLQQSIPPQQSSIFESNKQQLQLTPRRPPPQMRDAIKREAGGNKVMESILADTAVSTLPKMMQGEGRPHFQPSDRRGIAEQIVATTDPDEIFGEDATSKWASLAFMETPQRNK